MSTSLSLITSNDRDFLQFLKARYQLFHASNVFFRDLHYGVMIFLEGKGKHDGYTSTEALTRDVIAHFVQTGILLPIDERTWMLNYEEFRPITRKVAPPAKPAAPAAAPATVPATTV